MSLIFCPSCQQRVSDKASKCVKCGFVFEQKEILLDDEMISYRTLPPERKQALRDEFIKQNPNFKTNLLYLGTNTLESFLHKADKLEKYFYIPLVVAIISNFFLPFLPFFIAQAKGEIPNVVHTLPLTLIALVVFAVYPIVKSFMNAVVKKARRYELFYYKKYIYWLSKQNIYFKFDVSKYSEKEQLLYKDINPEYDYNY